MKHLPLPAAFCLALFAALFSTSFFPNVRLIAFAPFLCIAYTQKHFIPCLWLSFICGISIDLLSYQSMFGLHALSYCLTTVLLYRQKRHFFDDKSWALAVFTALFTCINSSLELLFISAFAKQMPISFLAIVNNTLVTSFLDALYAIMWFSYTVKIYKYIRKLAVNKTFRKTNGEE